MRAQKRRLLAEVLSHGGVEPRCSRSQGEADSACRSGRCELYLHGLGQS